MRVLVFCDEDLGVAGGGARQVVELSRALVRRGHEVMITAPVPLERQAAERACEGVSCRWVPVVRGSIVRPLSFLLASCVTLRRVMQEGRPDVLFWVDSPGQIAPLLMPRARRCPAVLLVNGLPWEEVRGAWAWPPLAWMLAWALRAAVRHASAVVSVEGAILLTLQARWKVPASRCHVVRNGVDPLRFQPVGLADARRRLGLKDGHQYIGFVGGFFPWHALDLLVEALPAVLAAIPTTRVVLVGDGQTRAAVQARAQALGVSETIQWPGRVPLPEISRWISACDVCVVLHRAVRSYQGDSMKLWEYLACERPVVATVGKGLGEFVEEVDCGVAVAPDDARALAQALIRLLRDGDLRKQMGARGRAAVLRAHCWEMRAAQLEAIFQSVASSEASARSWS